jgi:hypothetical protein
VDAVGLRGCQQPRGARRVVASVNDGPIRAKSRADIFAQRYENTAAVEDRSGAFVDERQQRVEFGFAVGRRRPAF